MRFLGTLFPSLASPEQKVQRGQRLLAQERFADARWAVDSVEGAAAEAVRKAASDGLAALNLREAAGLFAMGDEEGANGHLELAEEFGASHDDLRTVRRQGREQRETRQRERQEEEARRQKANAGPEGDDDLWALPPDDPRLQYAMQLESYPEDLRERLIALGTGLADAVLLTASGDPQAAIEALGSFVEQDPVVRYERAMAALALNNPLAASADLAVFGQEVGHQRIGQAHTATLLVQTLHAQGRLDEALTLLEAEVTKTPDELELRAYRAMTLEAQGELEPARKELAGLVKRAPKDMGLHRMHARVLIGLGERIQAANQLEAALERCCGSPGSCGNQKLDLNAVRMLARLYLEDRAAPERTAELLRDLAAQRGESTWDDAYLKALADRNAGSDTKPHIKALTDSLRPGDPRVALVQDQLTG